MSFKTNDNSIWSTFLQFSLFSQRLQFCVEDATTKMFDPLLLLLLLLLMLLLFMLLLNRLLQQQPSTLENKFVFENENKMFKKIENKIEVLFL